MPKPTTPRNHRRRSSAAEPAADDWFSEYDSPSPAPYYRDPRPAFARPPGAYASAQPTPSPKASRPRAKDRDRDRDRDGEGRRKRVVTGGGGETPTSSPRRRRRGDGKREERRTRREVDEEEGRSPERSKRKVITERERVVTKHKARESPATTPVQKRRDGDRHRERDAAGAAGGGTPGKSRDRDRDRDIADRYRDSPKRSPKKSPKAVVAPKHASGTSSSESRGPGLSLDSLAKLNAMNEMMEAKNTATTKAKKKKDKQKLEEETRKKKEKEKEYQAREKEREKREKKKYKAANGSKVSVVSAVTKRKVSHRHRFSTAPLLEEGRSEKYWDDHDEKSRIRGGDGGGRRGGRGGDDEDEFWQDIRSRRKVSAHSMRGNPRKRRKWLAFVILLVVIILIITIPVAVVESKKHNSSSASAAATSSSTTDLSTAGLPAESTIPASAKGTVLDPYTWLDTTDFNTTYTNETVGGLSVMGLNSTWSDTASANSYVPALNQNWTYGTTPIRGVNLGGWLCIEPFITPSLFDSYDYSEGVVDEYTLSSKLGSDAAKTIETHYATFVTEQTFIDIASAGLDHVRIPYPYWSVKTYDDDPYVPKIAWRYLLRGIEWARKHGLRVNLDLHSLPGSQNGFNHSGRQGLIRWLNGTDGTLNGNRSLELHDQLSQFFAQTRYDHVVTFYGLCNEPYMLSLSTDAVLDWNKDAIKIIRDNGLTRQYITFGDGFLTLTDWHDQFQDVDDRLVMDTHQYLIFNVAELSDSHDEKLNLTCDTWTDMLEESLDTSTGWGPIMNGEWSQADTDCATYLNNVGAGSRWEGNLDEPASNTTAAVTEPSCYLNSTECSCDGANAAVDDYSDLYAEYLRYFAESQMHAFESVWGWFYWTWDTENATQWSYKQGRAAGILPASARSPDFKCVNGTAPDFADKGLSEAY